MTYSPLIEGFRAGLRGRKIDTAGRLTVKTPPPSIAELAARYGVTVRTVYRWKRAGVALSDPLEIAGHIAIKSNSARAVHAALQTIKQP